MDEKTVSFMIWSLGGGSFILLSIYTFFAKKPMRFWANAKLFEVSDVKKYNHAVAMLFCIYGIIFILLGIPLMPGQNSSLVMISVVGVMLESIVLMVVYTLIIEKKYKKK